MHIRFLTPTFLALAILGCSRSTFAADPEVKPSTGITLPAKEARTLSFAGITCSIRPPVGFKVSERIIPGGKELNIRSPFKWKEGLPQQLQRKSVLTISIIPVSPNAPKPGQKIAELISQYHSKLKPSPFHEKLLKPLVIDGQSFESRSFTGWIPSENMIAEDEDMACFGEVRIARYRNVYVILTVEAHGLIFIYDAATFKKSLETMHLSASH